MNSILSTSSRRKLTFLLQKSVAMSTTGCLDSRMNLSMTRSEPASRRESSSISSKRMRLLLLKRPLTVERGSSFLARFSESL